MDGLKHAWDAATQDLAVWLIRALITTLVVTLMWWFWERIRRAILRLLGRTPAPPTQAQQPDWQEGYAVRLWPLDRLRQGVVIAPRTRLLVIDRDVVQFELEPGKYAGSDLGRRLARHAVGAGAMAVQVPDGGIQFERTLGAELEGRADAMAGGVRLGLNVDPHGFGKLARSSRLRNGVLTKDDVFAFVEEVVQPRLAQIAEHPAMPGVGSETVMQQIADHLHQELGLVGSVDSTVPAVPAAAHLNVPAHGPTS
ncbi:MAG TPA: hypothetical protein VN700_07940 [Vicinamibacterales bacterium]|nr:hypothetical protein [Vicinamibacterales bacterium]